jgi:hypothetical protein
LHEFFTYLDIKTQKGYERVINDLKLYYDNKHNYLKMEGHYSNTKFVQPKKEEKYIKNNIITMDLETYRNGSKMELYALGFYDGERLVQDTINKNNVLGPPIAHGPQGGHLNGNIGGPDLCDNNGLVPTGQALCESNEETELLIKKIFGELMVKKYNGFTVYIHNLAGFDSIFLLKILEKIGYNVEIQFKEGKKLL